MKKNLLLGLMAGLAALFSLVVSAEPVADYARAEEMGGRGGAPLVVRDSAYLYLQDRRAGITNSLRCSRRVADTRQGGGGRPRWHGHS